MSRYLMYMMNEVMDKYINQVHHQFGISKEDLKKCWDDLDQDLDIQDSMTNKLNENEHMKLLQNLNKMKISELKTLCKQYNIKKNGNKNELIEVLTSHLQEMIKSTTDQYGSLSIKDTLHNPLLTSDTITYPAVEDEEEYDFGEFNDDENQSTHYATDNDEDEFI